MNRLEHALNLAIGASLLTGKQAICIQALVEYHLSPEMDGLMPRELQEAFDQLMQQMPVPQRDTAHIAELQQQVRAFVSPVSEDLREAALQWKPEEKAMTIYVVVMFDEDNKVIKGVLGPFESEERASAYMESLNNNDERLGFWRYLFLLEAPV